MVYFDSKLHTACPYIQWSCEINWKLSQTVPGLFPITSGLKAGQGICGDFLESWCSAEALCSPGLRLQRCSEDVCGGAQQWQDWLETEACSCDCPGCGWPLRPSHTAHLGQQLLRDKSHVKCILFGQGLGTSNTKELPCDACVWSYLL